MECYGGGADVSSEVHQDLNSNAVLLSDHAQSHNPALICRFSQFQIHTKRLLTVEITLGWLQDKGEGGGEIALPLLPNPHTDISLFSTCYIQSPLPFHA